MRIAVLKYIRGDNEYFIRRGVCMGNFDIKNFRVAPEYVKKTKEQYEVLQNTNKLFLSSTGKQVGLISIHVVNLGYDEPDEPILIYFEVKKERDKKDFVQYKFEQCKKEFLLQARQKNEFKNRRFEFYVISREYVRKNCKNNYYYAMH